MAMLRIVDVAPLEGYALRLTLTDGTEVERNITGLMAGPIFEPLRSDRSLFRAVRVDAGTVIWPNGADLDPDVLIWGGPAPEQPSEPPPRKLKPRLTSRTA